MQEQAFIEVTGARVNNLKNISVRIPRNALTVITGLSGSGKSSLAFDTIFAEGQRRYIDTFSSYARGYIGTLQRPDVDKISGLSPVISIDQKTTGKNPRSTVGTITEVYDYLRLLYARAADAFSYKTGEQMIKLTDEQIIDIILHDYADEKILLLAPLINNRKGHYKELFDTIRKKGYIHVRVDGEVREVVPGMKVDRYQNHTIEVVVDRLAIRQSDLTTDDEDYQRIRRSIDQAMTQGGGMMMIEKITPDIVGNNSNIRYFSRTLMCPTTGLSYPEPAPHSFSFNSPQGWCPTCKGLGYIHTNTESNTLDEIIHSDDWYKRLLEYTPEEEDTTGTDERITCPDCAGKRLKLESLSFRFAGKNIAELAEMDISELLHFLAPYEKGAPGMDISQKTRAVAEPILKEICARLRFMLSVGLDYLSLSRPSDSLSGGESQRIRLATQIGSRLVNVLYILDEPSIGLHQRDNQRLIDSLKQLRDMGNTVIVVEHDEQIMREADYIVDIGPRAGRLGGQVVFQGTPSEMMQQDTLTAHYLRHPSSIEPLTSHLSPSPPGVTFHSQLVLTGACGNNLRHITAAFPLGKMIGVTGVSGSGKSTLVNRTLYPILSQRFYRSLTKPMPYDEIGVSVDGGPLEDFTQYIDKVIDVDQSPIGRTPRSNPATYTNVFSDIRALFAQLPESRMRGWTAGRFSFNAKGGRCEECAGNGYKTIEMHFMPNVYVPCETCGTKRYNRQTLEVRFKGKTIADILDMTVNQAVEFFATQPAILRKIKTIQDVGLGYIRLGQSSTTLSGGESQRIKLATELARPSTGRTLYILDEPTTGLHFEDIRVLMGVLRKLVDKGNTVIIIEHNLDILRACDHLIDLGPDGGKRGGEIVAIGTPSEIKNAPNSLTGQYL